MKHIAGRLWLAVFVAIAGYFLVHYVDTRRDVVRAFSALNRNLVLAAVACQLAYFFVTVAAWRQVIKTVTSASLSRWEALVQIVLVNFGKYVPGKIWGLTARGARLRQLGFDLNRVVRASYVEQLFLLGSGVILASVIAVPAFDEPVYIVPAILSAALLASLRFSRPLLGKAVSVMPRLEPLQRYFGAEMSWGRVLGLMGSFAAIWLCLGSAFFLLSADFAGIDFTWRNASIFVLGLIAGYLAGFIAVFAPGGVGVREGIAATILSSVMAIEEALFVMLLFRVWTIVWELLAGFLLIAKHRNAILPVKD